MKIGNSVDPLQTDAIARATGGAQPASSSSSGPVSGVQPGDKVQLSQTTLGLTGAAGADAEIRPEKVAQVQQAMREGNFRVVAEKVADKMIAQSAELLETIYAGGSKSPKGT